MHVLPIAQEPIHRALDVRIEMHGIDEVAIREAIGKAGYCPTNVFKASAKAFATMTGNENQSTLREIPMFLFPATTILTLSIQCCKQSVDDRVSRQPNRCRRHSFGRENLHRPHSWGTIKGSGKISYAPVHFLGPGRVEIAGSQAGLDMNEWNSVIECRQGRRHD